MENTPVIATLLAVSILVFAADLGGNALLTGFLLVWGTGWLR